MGKLSMYLPPFAPDYSGVCSALFDLNCLIVIHDAAGCTGNYTGFDEPRWYGSQKAVYCSGLRKMDVVMGSDKKFIDRICKAAKTLNPDFIAVVGSPVPLVMGVDFEGLATELEYVLRIPAIGFSTDGSKLYCDGIAQAGIALLKRFVASPKKHFDNKVNILGATPLDLSEENYKRICALIELNGYEIGAKFFMGLSLEQIEKAYESSLNIVVSQSGIIIAEYMYKEYGIPYVIGLPIGKECAGKWLDSVANKRQCEPLKLAGDAKILTLGESVAAISMQRALQTEFGLNSDVASPFGKLESACFNDVKSVEFEEDIENLVNDEKYELVIADPLINQLIKDKSKTKNIDLAQYAISSKLYSYLSGNFIGDEFNKNFEERLKYYEN